MQTGIERLPPLGASLPPVLRGKEKASCLVLSADCTGSSLERLFLGSGGSVVLGRLARGAGDPQALEMDSVPVGLGGRRQGPD